MSHAITTITPLPGLLYVGSLDKQLVPQYTHTLLKLLFFSKSEMRFLSYTETPFEISLVMDEESFKLFPEGSVQFFEKPWRAFQFSLGASPVEAEGVISKITAPLSEANISIFMLSTFNTDYILVEDANFETAKTVLKANFSILWADDQEINRDNGIVPQKRQTPISTGTIRELQSLSEITLFLTCVSYNQISECMGELINLIFFPQSKHRFISFTQTEDEVSLLIDSKSLPLVLKEKLEVIMEESWIPIRRQKKMGFAETGVISTISSPLSSFSLLYISSFQTGYVLVRKSEFNDVVRKLTESGFVVNDQKLDF